MAANECYGLPRVLSVGFPLLVIEQFPFAVVIAKRARNRAENLASVSGISEIFWGELLLTPSRNGPNGQ
jgi:hypothetical protein